MMKKIVVGFTVFMFLAVTSFELFAKSPLTGAELDSITAQEGVSIEFGGTAYTDSHFVILGNFMPQIQSWGDGNGFTGGGYTSAGWIGGKNMTMDASSAIYLYSTMTIDIGSSAGITKAFIGLPSALVHPVGLSQTFALGTTQDLNDGQPNLGTLYTSEFALLVNPTRLGVMSISNHAVAGTEGVEIAFSGLHPFMGSGYPQGVIVSIPGKPIMQSWGDADGFTGYTDPGYVGGKNMTLADGYPAAWPNSYFNLLISGTMSVDVGTSGSETAIAIGLPTINILPQSAITVPIALGGIRDFSDNQPLLGTSYMSGLSISPTGTLMIRAH